VAGYVRTLLVLGNWLSAEGLAKAFALRGLRRPHVPHKVIEPVRAGEDLSPVGLFVMGRHARSWARP
jgi:hypothetical protein